MAGAPRYSRENELTVTKSLAIGGAEVTIKATDDGKHEYTVNERGREILTQLAATKGMSFDQYLTDLTARAKAHGVLAGMPATGGKMN